MRIRPTAFFVAVALAVPVIAEPPTTAPTQSADEMIAAIHAVTMPALDLTKQTDQAYLREFMEQQNKVQRELIERRLAFVRAYPTHRDAAGSALAAVQAAGRLGDIPVAAIVDELVALPIKPDAKLTIRAVAIEGMIRAQQADLPAAEKAVDAFREQNPGDPRAAMLDFFLAQRLMEGGSDARMRRIASQSPPSDVSKMAAGSLRRVDGVGQPFVLAFDDLVTGKHIDVHKDWRDKVVVIDFWATWCGPCVAEMPNMKQLYAEYHDKGVEFVGVTLDRDTEDGRAKVLKYIADNRIPWPQFYEGRGWENDFSASWGINAIPCVFVVDRAGKLVTLEGGSASQLRRLLDRLLQAPAH